MLNGTRPLFLLSLVFQTPASPPGTYLTLSLTDLGFNTIQTNLLTIPYVAGTSEFLNEAAKCIV
jgi:hypothetical protein